MRQSVALFCAVLAAVGRAAPAPAPQDDTQNVAPAPDAVTLVPVSSETVGPVPDSVPAETDLTSGGSGGPTGPSGGFNTACKVSTFNGAVPANAQVLSAVKVAQGGTYGEGAANPAYPIDPTNLPELCAVTVKVTSSPSSSFRFGVFLPTKWNRKLLTVGNGGFAGGINWLDMGSGVRYGHAVASTDTGHNSTALDLSWALNAPEKRNDFGYRSIHGTVTIMKTMAAKYYAKAHTFSYYSGASTGGRQGLKEVQLYADSFDGALIGAPAWWASHLSPWTTKTAIYNLPIGAPNNIPAAQFTTLANEAIKQCDLLDGVQDGIISLPEQCPFNPNTLLCGSPTAPATGCFTAAQLQTVAKEYADYIANGQFAFPGFSVGSEHQWALPLGLPFPLPLGDGYMQYFLLNDPTWQWPQYNDSIVQLADAQDPGDLTADQYNMAAYRNRGGKILMYHGFSDALIATKSSTVFYNRVANAMGGVPALQSWFRYFLLPGMQHVAGTAVDAPWYIAGGNQAGSLGTDVYSTPGFPDALHDSFMALMKWVEQSAAPDKIIATTWNVQNDPSSGVLRQRPVCPFPKKQIYIGGNEKVPMSFKCA